MSELVAHLGFEVIRRGRRDVQKRIAQAYWMVPPPMHAYNFNRLNDALSQLLVEESICRRAIDAHPHLPDFLGMTRTPNGPVLSFDVRPIVGAALHRSLAPPLEVALALADAVVAAAEAFCLSPAPHPVLVCGADVAVDVSGAVIVSCAPYDIHLGALTQAIFQAWQPFCNVAPMLSEPMTVDEAASVFSSVAVIDEIFAGRPRHANRTPRDDGGAPASARSRRPDLPSIIDDVVTSRLASPDTSYATFAELRSAVAALHDLIPPPGRDDVAKWAKAAARA